MHNLKLKAVLISAATLVALLVAACAPNVPQPGPIPNPSQLPPRPTALPTRAISATTSIVVDGVLSLTVPSTALGFDVSSIVVSVTVSPGQTVKKGQALAAVDDTALQDAVVDAQLALKLSQANIALQNVPATQDAIAAAQAALNSAYASYKVTKAGTLPGDIENARRSVNSAWTQYLSAQKDRDAACGNYPNILLPNPYGFVDAPGANGCKMAEAGYGNAFESWLSARDALDKLLQPVSQNTLTQSYASVTSAQTKLDALRAGVLAQQARVDEATLSQARDTLQRAQASLSKATLLSPCDCVVQAVNVVEGVAPPGTAFVLVNLSALQFQTTNLVEGNLAQIKVGAPATVRLKAYGDVFSGTVSAVLSQSSGTQGTQALFTALIRLNPAQQPQLLLPGMTGQAQVAIQ